VRPPKQQVRVFHIGFSAKACAPHRQFCKSLM
jgi:hypothetical protein